MVDNYINTGKIHITLNVIYNLKIEAVIADSGYSHEM
jgi:hypothetical protein